MLLFLPLVECFYLLHKGTNRFIGEDPVDRPTPVPEKQAIDLRALRAERAAPYITVENAKRKSFDIRHGVWGTLLDYYPTHKKSNQSFLLVLTPNGSYALVQAGKCINWDKDRNQFIKAACSNYAEFDVFYEVSPAAESPKKDDEEINREFISLARGPKRPGTAASAPGRNARAGRPRCPEAVSPEPGSGVTVSLHTDRERVDVIEGSAHPTRSMDVIDINEFERTIDEALERKEM